MYIFIIFNWNPLKKHESDDGRTPSATRSAKGPQKHGPRRDRRACNPHYTPVLYAPDGREVRAG